MRERYLLLSGENGVKMNKRLSPYPQNGFEGWSNIAGCLLDSYLRSLWFSSGRSGVKLSGLVEAEAELTVGFDLCGL